MCVSNFKMMRFNSVGNPENRTMIATETKFKTRETQIEKLNHNKISK